jgi:hypothetical protein
LKGHDFSRAAAPSIKNIFVILSDPESAAADEWGVEGSVFVFRSFESGYYAAIPSPVIWQCG